jgi:hypothetical protein
VSAGVVEARRDQPCNAQPAHVSERRWRAGRVFRIWEAISLHACANDVRLTNQLVQATLDARPQCTSVDNGFKVVLSQTLSPETLAKGLGSILPVSTRCVRFAVRRLRRSTA